MTHLQKIGDRMARPDSIETSVVAESAAFTTKSAPSFVGEIAAVIESSEPQREIFMAVTAGGTDANLAYNESMLLKVDGRVDAHLFEQALEQVALRHDALRATFNRYGTQLCIHRRLMPGYRIVDVSQSADPQLRIEQERLAAVSEPFDLARGPLFRGVLIQCPGACSVIILTYHHIVCDGWSTAILLEELAELYSSLAEKRPAILVKPESYLQYLQWLQSNEYLRLKNADEDYWVDKFANGHPVLDLPADYQRPPWRTYRSLRCDRKLDRALVSALKKTGASLRSSFVSTLLAGFVVWLHRLSGDNAFVVGMPAAGQAIESIDRLIGHCVNTLPIRCQIDPALSFAQNLQRVRDGLLETYDHQRLTFGSLVARLGLKRDPSRVPLVPILFNIDQGIRPLQFAGASATAVSNPRVAESFELFLNATESQGELLLECQYNTDLYRGETIDGWLQSFEQLLRQIANDPQGSLQTFICHTAQDAALWQTVNATTAEYPRQACLHQVLSEVMRHQKSASVHCGEQTASHADLDQRAGRIAETLRQQGVKPGDFVGICMLRSLDMLISLLGVLKAGAAYVPLDPDYPAERLNLMIKDAGLATLVMNGGLPDGLNTAALTCIVDVSGVAAEGECYSVAVAAQSPAYMIYTSGSTGVPKGVMVPHGSVLNFLFSMAKTPGLTPSDHLLAVTTISFDIAVLELYLPLLVGAHLTIAAREDTKDGFRLLNCLQERSITVMQATPSTWRLLFAAGWIGGPGFKVLTGGEALSPALADELSEASGEVWNMYGPTETTVWSTVAKIKKGEAVTLGRPIANTCLAIVDINGVDAPTGVPGELLIGGEGVTLGYWQRPALNDERYVVRNGERYYKTGDLARLNVDGDLVYLGRLDNQVKLRGYRIELGEIEARVAEFPGVVEAVVVVQTLGEDDQRLVAFYRASSVASHLASSIQPEALREFLAQRLPTFMVPQHWVALDRMPMTPNGKIDRKALVASSAISADTNSTVSLSAGKMSVDAVTPDMSGATEAGVAKPEILAAFCKFLQRNHVSENADFFQQGGHSLLGMRLIAEINKLLDCQLGLNDLFQAPTAAALSALLDQRRAMAAPAAEIIPVSSDRTRFRMSLQQRRLWYLESLDGSGIEYNLPACWRFRGPLQSDAFARAVDRLVARHEALRTNLIEESDGLFQRVRHPRSGILVRSRVEGANENERLSALMAILNELKQRRFNLASDELFYAELIQLAEEDNVFFVSVHHAIFDGWSFDVMLADLAEAYNAETDGRTPQWPDLPVQYGDFSEWMRARTENGNETALKYWLTSLAGELPILELPTRNPRAEVQGHEGAAEYFEIDAATMERLSQFSRQQGATLFMVMMALFKVLLWRYSGQRDLIVGMPISGRSHADINQLIGFFVNTLALRDELDPERNFVEFLGQVKSTCLSGFEYQDIPFEQLVERLNPTRDLSRSPIFQVMFAYQDITNRREMFGGLKREQINVDRAGVQTDVDFWLKWTGDVMVGGFEYERTLFSPSLMKRLCEDFVGLAQRLPDHALKPVRTLTHHVAPALQQVLRELNATAQPLPIPALVHAQFAAQVQRSPQAVAVIYRGASLSYAALDARANRISHWLTSVGVKPGDRVGVAVSPSLWLQAVLLGVLKRGCTYIPVDPNFPIERIRYMIDNSALFLLLHDDALSADLIAAYKDSSASTRAVHVNTLEAAQASLSDAALNEAVDPDSAAYIIYTSGSTGQPKGVVISHRAVVNYLNAVAQRPGFGAQDRILAATTLSFDIAVTELFLPLVTGGSSVLIDRDVVTDADLLRDMIESNGVTVYQATPSSWRLLLGVFWRGDRRMRAWVGGEALPADLIERLLPKVGELWNVYGPTETTVWSTCHRVHSTADVGLIGTPLANTRCYVLNAYHQVVPLGVIGELCIGGDGVAREYFNRPDLTAERFIADPFGEGRLYRTGDYARLRENGVLEYVGRMDHQVKVRGYRIELAEIELALSTHSDIQQAVALARELETGDARLIAYVVSASGQPLDSAALRTYLQTRLPVYMIPQNFVQLTAMPMTPNLKIDRNALPDPGVSVATANIRLPESMNQKLLATIWKEALKIEQVSLEDNFFDQGGHSLTAVDVIRRIRMETGYRFELREFIMETLEQLAAKIDQAQQRTSPLQVGAAPIPVTDERPHAEEIPSVPEKNGRWAKLMQRMKGKTTV